MISLIRLRDGTEVVGNVTDVTEEGLTILDPLQINYKITIMQPAPSMGLSRFMPFSESTEFHLLHDHITVVTKARESLAQYYNFALDGYILDLDRRINEELVGSATEEDQTPSDLYAQLLEKLEPSGNMQ